MSETHERGVADRFEIHWMNGHVEYVLAHQVTYPHAGLAMFGARGIGVPEQPIKPRIQFHAEIDGRWTLTLSALEDDIRTVRLATADEEVPRA